MIGNQKRVGYEPVVGVPKRDKQGGEYRSLKKG